MPRTADGENGSRYLLRFGVTALLLVAGTLVLVLYVLPERYVLSSGFRESGMSFPTPTTPFVPVPVVVMAARDIPQPPLVILPGPAEIFWEEVTPLIEEERYTEAIARFESYLDEYPDDADARREYAITLLAADRPEDAVRELRTLLAEEDDPERRLLLARALRELGRASEAAEEYATLVEARPGDAGLWLEWGQAHAWAEEYDEAAAVLQDALELHPESVPLRVELARVEYARGGLEAAEALLADIDDAALAREAGLVLRNDVRAALVVPDSVIDEPEPPTLLEQAVAAREDDDFARALELFEMALEESPADPDIWQAYADFLEYEMNDFEGARSALLEVERLREPDAALEYRLAQLEIWTDRNEQARVRLLPLLALAEADPEATAPVTAADVHAMLGDLDRWDGDRVAAARRYRLALDDDPDNQRALDGMEAIQAEVADLIAEVEAPGIAATSYAAADTDDFSRLDVGGQWVEVGEDWRWGGSAGNRWLDGRGLTGLLAERQQGVYLDLEAARWWRWGTLRSAARFGVERVRDVWDYRVGASLQHRGTAGSQTELRYEHGPAYPVTVTLQSAMVGVVQDHVSVSHARRLDVRWTVSALAEAAWLRAELDTIPGARNENTVRLQAALSLGRQMSESLTLGGAARAMGYTSAGPVVTGSTPSVDRRLFWDPRLAISVGPFVRLDRYLAQRWRVTGNLGPGVAFLDERSASGWDVVPHVSAEAGLRREGERFWTALDFFFYQGQFDGYRMYGARLTVSARDWSSTGSGR